MSDTMEDWLKSDDCKDYFKLLAFPTVGASLDHLRDCAQCATWLKKWLATIGAKAELILPKNVTPPVPVVWAEIPGPEESPSVLFYGHYDVQPPDPVELWHSPPFEPTVRDGRVYCRGAQDDKGQLFAFLCGLRAYLTGFASDERPPMTIKILLEGQEESGSTGLFSLLEDATFRKRLSADVLLVSDTSAGPDLRPAIVAGLRGVNHFTVRLTAAARDLHSGEYGGIAPNAAQGMARLLASLHNSDGSIAVAGFRDGIECPSADELREAEKGLADESVFADDIGTEPCGGQIGKTLAQRGCFEPTIEINGIHTGYGGPGSKTVIPCEAIAKISTRLVPGQNPRSSYEAIRCHLEEHCPRGMKVDFPEQNGLSPAIRLPLSSPLFRLAASVLEELDPRGTVYEWCGASIPVVAALKQASGAAPLLVGWGQPEDRIHSPDESFSSHQFDLAKRWAMAILPALF